MDEYLTLDDQRRLDRLVDGELTDAERRELLLRLDHSPDGWRRCALAFLESQAWRCEARSLLAEPAGSPFHTAKKVQPASMARRAWESSTIWVPLAAAAGFLIAAVYVEFGSREPDGGGVPAVVRQEVPSPATAQVAADVQPAASSQPRPNIHLVVAVGPDGRPQIVEVPLVEGDRSNETMFGALPHSIPPEILRMFEQNGNQIVRERRLMPFDLDDGRRVVVPMEQLEIQPVNLQSFQ